MRTLLLFLASIPLLGQSYFSGVDNVTADPSGACAYGPAPGHFGRLQYNITNGNLWGCQSGTWTLVTSTGGGGGGGTVTSISGSGPSWLTWTIGTPTTTPAISLAPTTGQSSHQVIGTCGAATAFAPCALVAGDLPSTAVTPGSYTITNLTVDQQGRITAATNGSAVTSVATSNGITGGTITTTGTISGVDAAADGSTKGVSAFTASDFNASSGVISLDYANGQKATGSQSGFLLSSDWTTFNNKGSVTSVATTAPITGGTITGTGTIACATCVTSAASLTSNLPVIGAGSQATAVGTVSGNTTQFVTTTGAQTSGNCVNIDANGNHIASGIPCGGSSGVAVISPPYLVAGTTYYCGSPLQACTPPVAANYTWCNQPTGATDTANGSAIILHAIPAAAHTVAVRCLDISPNTTLDTLFSVTVSNADFAECGVGFAESSTNKLMWFGFLGGTSSSNVGWSVKYYSNYTTFGTTIVTSNDAPFMPQETARVRLKYDGTNIYFYTSNDGVSWLEYYQEAKAAHLTTAPNKFFYACESINSSTTTKAGDAYMELLHWSAF